MVRLDVFRLIITNRNAHQFHIKNMSNCFVHNRTVLASIVNAAIAQYLWKYVQMLKQQFLLFCIGKRCMRIKIHLNLFFVRVDIVGFEENGATELQFIRQFYASIVCVLQNSNNLSAQRKASWLCYQHKRSSVLCMSPHHSLIER